MSTLMTDGELREKIMEILMVKQVRPLSKVREQDPQGWANWESALHHARSETDKILHLIKQNSPQGGVVPSLKPSSFADDSSIPGDAGELREAFRNILDPQHGRWLSNSGANDGAIEAMYMQLEHLIHQQRERWEARARLAEAKYWEQSVVPAVRGYQFDHEIEKRFKQLEASLAADEGKEDA